MGSMPCCVNIDSRLDARSGQDRRSLVRCSIRTSQKIFGSIAINRETNILIIVFVFTKTDIEPKIFWLVLIEHRTKDLLTCPDRASNQRSSVLSWSSIQPTIYVDTTGHRTHDLLGRPRTLISIIGHKHISCNERDKYNIDIQGIGW
jgi:hypothetical protein